MTNVLLLSQLGAIGTDGSFDPAQFFVATNGDWRDVLPFLQPNSQTALDLTGIAFRAVVRAKLGGPVLLDLSTASGVLVNGGMAGTLSFAVPAAAPAIPSALSWMGRLAGAPGQCLMDLLATGDGATINLCAKAGPALVNVRQGVA